MENVLADDGFAFAHVDESATLSVVRKSATVTYDVKPGPRVRIGTIEIEGLRDFDERVVRGKMLHFDVVDQSAAPIEPEPFPYPSWRTRKQWEAFLHEKYLEWGKEWEKPR